MIFYAFVNITFSQQSPSNVLIGRLVSVSPKLTDLTADPSNTKKKEETDRQDFRDRVNPKIRYSINNPKAKSNDQIIQKSIDANLQNLVPLVLSNSFNGNTSADNTTAGFGGLTPPDPVVCVGPNHVVQMINLVHKVYNKSGTVLSGPLKFSQIAGSGASDDGDPIALYDNIADRYILLQFSNLFTSGGESLIFCVSQTNDPTGAYFVYKFLTTGVFPDYPHVGVWNNSYVVTTHNFNTAGTAYVGQGFFAFDRSKMVNGEPTVTGIAFNATTSTDFGYLPASFEGSKTPDPTSQPTFVTFDADEFGGIDQLLVRTLTPNFNNPAASVLSATVGLPVAAFDARSPSSRSSIEQKETSTTVGLDAIADRMMSRIVYRRFDDHESLVMNHVVNVSGVNPTTKATFQAATRWYELTRTTPASPWVVNQQSTYSPTGISGTTGINRWMGCVGIDQKGNMALGYSRSSSVDFPDIYYAERRRTDALSALGAEQVFHASNGVQTSTGNRWGDYSAMTADPVDDETMWYTAEYYAATSQGSFSTRIGSFKVNDPIMTITTHFQKGGTITRQKESTIPSAGPPGFPYKDYPITVMIDNTPTQNANLTLSKTGTATEGIDYDLFNTSALVLNGANLSQTFILRIYDNGIGEADEYINLAYTLNANGGNAVTGVYNQQHRITIIGTSVCPTVNVVVTRPTTFCQGDSVIFNANFDAGYMYQWFKDMNQISGATQAQYIAKTSGNYRVEITSGGCTISSSLIPITVIPIIVPIVGAYSVCQNTNVPNGEGLVVPATLTNTVNGSLVSGSTYVRGSGDNTTTYTASRPVFYKTYTFVASTSGAQTFTTTAAALTPGDPDDTYLSFYQTAFNPDAPATNFLHGDDDGGVGFLSSFTQTLVEGTTYIVVVGTFSTGVTGTFTLSSTANVFSGGTNQWFTTATDGAPIFTGEIFNPVGVAGSGITNTATVGTTTFYVATNTSPACRTPVTFTITNSVGGTVTADATVCNGNNSGTLTLTGYTGTILRWESSTDNFVTPVIIANSTPTQAYLNLTQTTKYRAVVQSGTCTSANSSPATITINTNVVVAGSVTSSASVCASINSGTLMLSGHSGTVVNWESSIDNFATVVTITNTTTTLNYLNLTQTTKFRAIVEGTPCGVATLPLGQGYSNAATITVNPLPVVSVSTNQTICTGTSASLTATCGLQLVTTTLSGASEVPVNASTATGSVLGTFNPTTNQLNLTVTFSGLTSNATAGHIHTGAIGTNGSIIIPFTVPSSTAGTFNYSGVITSVQATALLAGNTYVNIHNANFSGGEIRGQLNVTCVANSFVWNPGALSGQTVSISPTVTTTYTLTASNSSTTCFTTTTTTVTVLTPATPVATGATIVLGSSVTLTATGCSGAGFALKWYETVGDVAVIMPVSPTEDKQYYAKCEQTMGALVCLSPKSNEVTVTVQSPPAVVVYVNQANFAAPIQNGLTWETAYSNLQTALGSAPSGSEIWTAKGTYKPTTNSTRTMSFNIPNGAMLLGGFVGTETNKNQRNFMINSTILSGEIGSETTAKDNSYHIVVFVGVNNTTRLDGFTITAGNANLTTESTQPLPQNAFLPVSVNDGGGIALDEGSAPIITNCNIIDNKGIMGGGLFATNGSNPTLLNCKFMGNQATFGGGAYHLGSSPTYQNVIFSGNKATGGAIYNNGANPIITNATIVGNGGNNGAVFNSKSIPVIKNSIIFGNGMSLNDNQSIITYSIVEGGYVGAGNLNLNPQFINMTPSGLAPTINGNNSVMNTSPTIDGGENGTISLVDKDVDGNLRRFNGGIVDMGAYEFQGNRVGLLVISIRTGNWEDGTTWDIGRQPLAGDSVIINDNHIVTINNTGTSKNLQVKTNAKIIYSLTFSKTQLGY